MGGAAYHRATRCGCSIANADETRAEPTSPDYSPVATIYRWSRCHPEERRICTDIGDRNRALWRWLPFAGMDVLEILPSRERSGAELVLPCRPIVIPRG